MGLFAPVSLGGECQPIINIVYSALPQLILGYNQYVPKVIVRSK